MLSNVLVPKFFKVDLYLLYLHHTLSSAIFDRLRSANLKLNPKKCYFAREEVTYLGHTISSEGIRVDQEKVKAVLDFPRPKSAKEVRSYLGLCSYYRRFIKDFAKIANPLNALLKKDVKFKWTETCENSFITLKEKLTSAPVLAYPDSPPIVVMWGTPNS